MIQGPIGEDTPATDIVAGRRYVLAAITNDSLKYDLANMPDVTTGPQMLEYIAQHWLAGRNTSDILRDALHGLRYREGASLHGFVAEISMLISNITDPIITSRQAWLRTANRATAGAA